MKLAMYAKGSQKEYVAPRTGAWIETLLNSEQLPVILVAPRTGAWIETSIPWRSKEEIDVAPRTGAWIETTR